MPNAFELANGLDPDWPLDAAGDLDGDGVSNLDEFIGDTDPNDPNDPEPAFFPGDMNGNGEVNNFDIGCVRVGVVRSSCVQPDVSGRSTLTR